jgi:hypothetical protein
MRAVGLFTRKEELRCKNPLHASQQQQRAAVEVRKEWESTAVAASCGCNAPERQQQQDSAGRATWGRGRGGHEAFPSCSGIRRIRNVLASLNPDPYYFNFSKNRRNFINVPCSYQKVKNRWFATYLTAYFFFNGHENGEVGSGSAKDWFPDTDP